MSESRARLLLFTGAGASRAEPLNLPTCYEFFARLLNGSLTLTDDRSALVDVAVTLEQVLFSLYGHADLTKYDIEELYQFIQFCTDSSANQLAAFATFQSAHQSSWRFSQHASAFESIARQLPATRKVLQRLRLALERAIFEVYSRAEPIPSDELYRPLFDVIVECLERRVSEKESLTLPVFTTNYDRSLDLIFENQSTLKGYSKIRYDGFRELNGQHLWDPKNYAVQLPAEDAIAIQYFKLHGSLRWRRYENGDIEKTTVQELPDSHAGAVPMVIYPGTRSADELPWRTMFEWFERRLLEADVLIMIGCSLRDDLVNERIQKAMIENDRLNLFLVKRGDLDVNQVHRHGGLQAGFWLRESDKRMVQIKHAFGSTEAIDRIKDELAKRWP